MKIKYEVKREFRGIRTITPCPNGHKHTMVESGSCNLCHYYGHKLLFKNEIVCKYDKYNKEI